MLATELAKFFESNDYDKVCHYFDETEGFDFISDPLASHVYAASLFQLGQFSRCLDVLQAIQPSIGSNIEFAILYGATLRRLSQHAEALQFFEQAVDSFPDNLPLLNNFSNLLIDLDRLDEALDILTRILSIDPSYSDAQQNLNRLNFKRSIFQSQKQSLSSSAHVASSDASNFDSLLHGGDPLLLAFEPEEVKKFGRLTKSSKVKKALPESDQSKVSLDQLKLAQRAIVENEPRQALRLCSQALRILGPNPQVYSVAADAFISLSEFSKAEIYTHLAISLSHPTVKHFLNLANFAAIRGDFRLSSDFLEKASMINPNHPSLLKVRSALSSKLKNSGHHHFDFLAINTNALKSSPQLEAF